jgi:hypothetical protein
MRSIRGGRFALKHRTTSPALSYRVSQHLNANQIGVLSGVSEWSERAMPDGSVTVLG